MALTHQKISLSDVPLFSKRDLAYINEVPDLRPFYRYPVKLEEFANVIADKKREATNRALLVEVLTEQYRSLPHHDKVKTNVEALSQEHCYTVTTAHQPVLFTGPWYYIYKILSTIKLAEILKEAYPDHHFVPVFVSGAEDHDFEEVNHTTIFGKTITWTNAEKGPVGLMSTASLEPVLNELSAILGDSPEAISAMQLIRTAYTQHNGYGMATVHLVHELFKSLGLVVIDMSAAPLKRAAIPLFKEELLHFPSKKLVGQSIAALQQKGYKPQATPRDLNLFFLGDQFRERIVVENGVYRVLNTNITFTETEILEQLEQHPERFSPNVVMRPLYQESILPNLAYVGGGGEIAYWLERKAQFEHFGINFPMLIRRCSGLVQGRSDLRKMTKLGLAVTDLFEEEESLVKQYVHNRSDRSIDLGSEREEVRQLFERILAKAQAIDPTLKGSVKAEESKWLKGLKQLENKMMKAEKGRLEIHIKQLRQLKSRLFPEGGLQERKVNFLSHYLTAGTDDMLQQMKEAMNPLEKSMVIFQLS